MKKDRKKGGRPKKSVSHEKRDKERTIALVKDMKAVTGMKYDLLADTYFPDGGEEQITGDTLRQYSSGKRSASAKRRKYMASSIVEKLNRKKWKLGGNEIEQAAGGRYGVMGSPDAIQTDELEKMVESEISSACGEFECAFSKLEKNIEAVDHAIATLKNLFHENEDIHRFVLALISNMDSKVSFNPKDQVRATRLRSIASQLIAPTPSTTD